MKIKFLLFKFKKSLFHIINNKIKINFILLYSQKIIFLLILNNKKTIYQLKLIKYILSIQNISEEQLKFIFLF